MSYIIPPRLRKSDYTKGAITQDEYLRIAAANDANIAAARKAVKMGEVVQLTPVQSATPDELLADIGKQESDARSNLLRLGFRDQEASSIVAQLINEPDVLRMLNINFPSIEADIKKRFNQRLVTPTFFLEYLREYNDTLVASRGLDVNSSAAVRRPLNALINNVAELKAIIPDRNSLDRIVNELQRSGEVSRSVVENISALRDVIPTEAQLRALQQEGSAESLRNIQRILDALQDVPTRDEVDEMSRNISKGIREVGRENLIALANSVPNKREIEELKDIMFELQGFTYGKPEAELPFPQNIPPMYSGLRGNLSVPSGQPIATGSLGNQQAEQVFYSDTLPLQITEPVRVEGVNSIEDFRDLNFGDKKKVIKRLKLQDLIDFPIDPTTSKKVTISNLTKYILEGDMELNFQIESLVAEALGFPPPPAPAPSTPIPLLRGSRGNPKTETPATSRQLEREVEEEVSPLPFQVITEQTGLGMKRLGKGYSYTHPTILAKVERKKEKGSGLKKIKLGKGISVAEQPTYKEFGKYAIHIPQLEDQDILNVKYKSLGGIPKFKPFPVSDVFRDFLLDILDGKRANERVYLQIDPKERKSFEEIAIGAGVWSGLGLKRTTTNDDEEDRKRFEVLRGIYTAGNNSPQVLQELRRLVVKFMNNGKMKKNQGLELLMELSI